MFPIKTSGMTFLSFFCHPRGLQSPIKTSGTDISFVKTPCVRKKPSKPPDMPGHNMELKIEPLTLSDLDEVMRIERLSFPNPWTRGMFESELKNPVSSALAARAVGKAAGGIIAYCVFWIVQGEAHILNLAVDPDWRRKGVAVTLLQSILDYMRPRTVFEVFLEVRTSNIAAIRLYKGLGFREAYVRKKYYGDEDAIVMSLEM